MLRGLAQLELYNVHAHDQDDVAHSFCVAHVARIKARSTTNFSFIGSDPVAEKTGEMQKQINEVGKEWANDLAGMESAYQTVHGIKGGLDAEWKKHHDKLEGICIRLRDALDDMTTAHKACKQAQDDPSGGLPALFKKKAKDEQRFSRFQGGIIKGCAGEGDGDSKYEAKHCECSTGTEESGCQDAQDDSDHRLQCTQQFDRAVNALDLPGYFKRGGICNLDGTQDYLKPAVPPSTWIIDKTDEATVGPHLIALAAFLPAVRGTVHSLANARTQSRSEHLAEFWGDDMSCSPCVQSRA